MEANACVRVGGEFSESFAVEVGVRLGCVMSPWLFNMRRVMPEGRNSKKPVLRKTRLKFGGNNSYGNGKNALLLCI